jgi:hypothetical protein
MSLSLTTELDAINQMLDVIGEAPVATVDDTGLVDAALARDLLRRVSREVQAQGWHWNIDEKVELLPENPLPGNIRVPPDAIRCDPSDDSVDAAVRGGRLWNRAKLTFAWPEAIRCDIVRLLPFEDLPETARQYITIRAARQFQDRRIGSEARNGFNQQDEVMAKVTLENAEAQTADLSLAGSFSVGRVLNPWSPLGPGWVKGR